MKNILTASAALKAAILDYFTENVEFKVRRVIVVFIPLIIIGAYVAWYVNNHH
jgi:hypothetical protein